MEMEQPQQNSIKVENVTMRTLFAPYHNTYGELMAFLKTAKKSIHLMIFGFTLADVADLLIEKHKAGVEVRIVCDYEQSRGQYEAPLIRKLVAAGVDVVIGTTPIIKGAPPAKLHSQSKFTPPHKIGYVMHTKACVVDGEWMEDGSWNYSGSAPAQCNTMNFCRNAARAKLFLVQFNYIRDWILQHQPKFQIRPMPKHALLPGMGEAAAAFMAEEVKEAFNEGEGQTFTNLTVTTLFAPYFQVEKEFLSFLDKAKKSIDMMVYELRSQVIVDKLVALADRGVKIRVVLDRSMYKSEENEIPEEPLVETMQQHGIEVVNGHSPCHYRPGNPKYAEAIMHTKATIVDGQWVWDGSWNYTPSADFEANTVNIVHSKARAAFFEDHFVKLWDYMHSRQLVGVE